MCCRLRGIFNNFPLLSLSSFSCLFRVKGAARLAYSASTFPYLREAAEQSHYLLICLLVPVSLPATVAVHASLFKTQGSSILAPSHPPPSETLCILLVRLDCGGFIDCGDGSAGPIISCLSSLPAS